MPRLVPTQAKETPSTVGTTETYKKGTVEPPNPVPLKSPGVLFWYDLSRLWE